MKRPRIPRRAPPRGLPPPGLRPKLTRDQIASIGIIHVQTVADIREGKGTQQLLLDHANNTLVWLTLARDYQARYGTVGEALRVLEAAQAACTELVARWRRTGRVVFAGPELQMALEAIPYMDALAELVDAADADAAGRAAIAALRDLAPELETSPA